MPDLPPELDPRHKPYEPYGASLRLMKSRDEEILVSGPAGCGKSRACLEKLNLCALRYPGMRGLIVRKTRESISESALVTFEEKVLPEGSPIAAGPSRRMRQSYHYPNGSEVVVGGMDKPSKVMSTEYDLIYVQEAIELFENDWESLTTRLRNGVMPYQQVIADTNPDSPQHWLYQRFRRNQTTIMEARHEDNPTLWDRAVGAWTPLGRAYIAKLDALTGTRKPRLRFGRWVQAEGVVYEDWDRSVHIIDRFEIPDSWRRIRAIDFRYTNPFVCLWIAVDHDGRMYVYREIYRTRRLVADHAQEILRLSEGERIEVTIADHDAEDRATLYRAGIPTAPAKKPIKPGIEEVQKRLRVQGVGKPRLFVFRDALVERDPALDEAKLPCCLVEEFDGYTWPKGQDGKTVKEVPVGMNDHALDALRYGCMDTARRGSPSAVLTADEQRAKAQSDEEVQRKIDEEDQRRWLNVMNDQLFTRIW
jgi:phage terminase large subunit